MLFTFNLSISKSSYVIFFQNYSSISNQRICIWLICSEFYMHCKYAIIMKKNTEVFNLEWVLWLLLNCFLSFYTFHEKQISPLICWMYYAWCNKFMCVYFQSNTLISVRWWHYFHANNLDKLSNEGDKYIQPVTIIHPIQFHI